MPKEATAKPARQRRQVTTTRFLKLTKESVKSLGLDANTVTVAEYIEALRDKALAELGL